MVQKALSIELIKSGYKKGLESLPSAALGAAEDGWRRERTHVCLTLVQPDRLESCSGDLVDLGLTFFRQIVI